MNGKKKGAAQHDKNEIGVRGIVSVSQVTLHAKIAMPDLQQKNTDIFHIFDQIMVSRQRVPF